MTHHQGLLAPLFLLLSLLLIALFALQARRARRKRAVCQRLGVTPPSRHTSGLLVLIPVLLIVATARPYWGTDAASVPDTENELMLVVDVSRSMAAKDVAPSRINLAKRKLRDIIDLYTKRGIPQRYGITLFAGNSYVLCPTTSDVSVVKQFVDEISPDIVTSLGSRITLGLKTALERYTREDPAGKRPTTHARVLLVSDGEDQALVVQEAADLVRASGVRVDVLGVGTPEGSSIPDAQGGLLRDAAGAVVQSSLNEESLQAIAEAGGGIYRRATLSDADIEALATSSLAPIAPSGQSKRTLITYRELGPFLSLAALVALLVVVTVFRDALIALVLFAGITVTPEAFAQPAPHELPLPNENLARRGYDLYQQGEYKEAAEVFKNALSTDPTNAGLRQSYASSLYKSGRLAEALTEFQAITRETSDGKVYFENTYNEGNSLLGLGRYRDAIDAFNKALDVKPDDEQALHNLAVAKALLEEEKRRPTPTPTPTASTAPENAPSPQPSDTPPSPPPSASPSSADSDQSETSTPSPQATAAATSQPNGSGTLAPSPTASGDEQEKSEDNKDGTKSATPTPSSGAERQKEANDPLPENQSAMATPAPLPSAAPEKAPSQREAEAWLESLPESPLIITKERGDRSHSGQTW